MRNRGFESPELPEPEVAINQFLERGRDSECGRGPLLKGASAMHGQDRVQREHFRKSLSAVHSRITRWSGPPVFADDIRGVCPAPGSIRTRSAIAARRLSSKPCRARWKRSLVGRRASAGSDTIPWACPNSGRNRQSARPARVGRWRSVRRPQGGRKLLGSRSGIAAIWEDCSTGRAGWLIITGWPCVSAEEACAGPTTRTVWGFWGPRGLGGAVVQQRLDKAR